MSETSSELDRSEQDRSEQDRMERLMELQSRLRELTEARKDKWRRMGSPLADEDPPEPPPVKGDRPPSTESSPVANGASPATAPAPAASSMAAAPRSEANGRSADVAPDAAEVAVRAAEVAVQAAETKGAGTFVRRRGLQARAFHESLQRNIARIGAAARDFGETVGHQVAGRLRDPSGGLGARKQATRPRPGDPITAEDLIDDRSLSARLVGAAVFLVGVLVIGGVLLVQLGKLEVPWLEDSSLPAATSRSPMPAGGGAAAVERGETSRGGAADRGGEEASGGADGTGGPTATEGGGSTDPAALGSESPSDPDRPASASISAPGASSGGTTSPDLREFTRLQGDLAFRVGEYELARVDFESGEADCATLTERYAQVDRSHLVLSRVVARSRDLPRRQEQAYEELSALLDGVLQHYSASGCGLDASELPD